MFSIIAAKMAQYMIGPTRGLLHQLLVDIEVTEDFKTRKTNLCSAWDDYKKTYCSVSHPWILVCLEL